MVTLVSHSEVPVILCLCGNPECQTPLGRGNKQKFFCSMKCAQRHHFVNNKQRYYARRDRRKRQGEGSYTQAEWEELLEAYDGRCVYCGCEAEHADHYVPLALGGSNYIDNIRPACADCNLRKGSKHPEDWLREQGHKSNVP